MRIDVERDPQRMQAELDILYERFFAPMGRPGLTAVDWNAPPHLRCYRRTADGEHYVYVEDALRGRLAGCVVFNRLPRLDRRLDAHVRSPHSRFRPAYQRQGLATLIYRHVLDAGICLVSGARQSPAAHRLWQKLGQHYPLGYVRLDGRRVTPLPPQADGLDDLDTRLLLCGVGWDAHALAGLADARCARAAAPVAPPVAGS